MTLGACACKEEHVHLCGKQNEHVARFTLFWGNAVKGNASARLQCLEVPAKHVDLGKIPKDACLGSYFQVQWCVVRKLFQLHFPGVQLLRSPRH